jgi:hypothetical protein
MIISISGCGEKTQTKDKPNTSVATKPSPKLQCDDPLLESQMQFLISNKIYKSRHLFKDHSDLFTIELLSHREISRESVDVGNNMKAERIKCEADLNIKLVDDQFFVKANEIHNLVVSKGAEGLSINNNYGRSFKITYFPTTEESSKGAEKSIIPMPSEVKGNITYVAALEVNESELAKGNYFVFNSEFNVKYLQGFKFGDPSFVESLRDAEVVMSWLDPDFKITGSNAKNWSGETKDKFANICKRFQYQISQCDCIAGDLQNNFSEEDYLRAEQSALFIDGQAQSSKSVFPFKPTKGFSAVYPDVWNYIDRVVQQCSKQ